MKFNFLTLGDVPDSLIALFVIVGVAALIGAVAFGIYKILNPKLKVPEKSEEERVAEHLKSILEPVEDEEAAKQISAYKEKDD